MLCKKSLCFRLNPPRFAQRREYWYRAVNHQRLLGSWNTLRTVMRSPMFYAHIAGVGTLVGMVYCYNLERTPVGVPEYVSRKARD